MELIQTDFAGLLLIRPVVYKDNRGLFYEDWQQRRYEEAGICTPFVQDDVSISSKGVLRGLHGQKGQSKLIQIIKGTVLDALVDLRPQSKTFLKYFSIILSEDRPAQLFAPDGFVHGFYVMSDQAIMHYKCSSYHDKNLEYAYRYNDPTFHIDWPNDTFILSERDQRHPFYQQ